MYTFYLIYYFDVDSIASCMHYLITEAVVTSGPVQLREHFEGSLFPPYKPAKHLQVKCCECPKLIPNPIEPR